MSYCVEHAIPHSIFIGRVQTPDEPYWLEEDRAKTMAMLLEKAEVCSRCGTADWEWQLDMDAYTPLLHRCHGCLILSRAEEGQRGPNAPPGETMRLAPKAVARRMRHAAKPRPQRRRRRD